MEQLILDYLTQNWSADHVAKLNFSPVPKGQSGDLAVNFFALTKELGKSPIEIGKEVAEILQDCPLLEKAEQSGPYLNLFFSIEKFFEQALSTQLESDLLENKTIVVEYSGPNTNKPLHLGHMRNHALGISVSNLLESAGGNIKRVNIINDKGLALAKTMLAYDRFQNGETPESADKKPDQFVGDCYVQYETEYKKNPELEKELPEIMRLWEAQDPKWYGLWRTMTDWVLEGVEQTYTRQGVWFDKAYKESDMYEEGKAMAYDGLERGVFYKSEDGAILIDLEEEDLGQKAVLRADGTAIYLTNDLATDRKRYEDYKYDLMIHVVADEQAYYFKTLFISLEKLGVLTREHFHHLSYGLVNLPDGRMKSREGTVVDADNLMDELSGIAKAEISTRNPELPEAEQHKIAEQIMNGAWKFFLLRTSPNKTITFDAKKSIDFQGATGPYLQYAGVRIKSIFEKEGIDMTDYMSQTSNYKLSAFTDSEKPLGVKILEWPKVLTRSAEGKNPTLIVTYLLELAQSWSSFYAENSVLGAETEELKQARLALAGKVYSILEKGLEILGIEIPERM